MKIISIDAETGGLWGRPFAVAAQVYNFHAYPGHPDSGQWHCTDIFLARLPDEVVQDEWVIENVLPTLDFDPEFFNYGEMLESFAEFYLKHKDATPLWHMGHVVEAYLFRECVRLGFIGKYDAPYTPIEVHEVLRCKGFKPDSVDSYAKEHKIKLPEGSTHNPLYDCEVAARVYFHLLKNS